MPITGDSTIVSITDPGRWNPGSFTAHQFTDYLDLRATLAASSGTVSFMRAYASADVRFAGEVWLQNGAIRGERTLSLACFDSSQDLVSFRSGPGPGTEQLRILASGTIASADASTLGLRSNVRNVTSEEYPTLLEAFRLLSAAVPASGQAYLVLRAGSATNNRLLTVFGDLTNGTTLEFSTSGDGASGNLKDTTIRANSLKFNNAAGTRLTVTNGGSLQVTPESGGNPTVQLDATATATTGVDWRVYSDSASGTLKIDRAAGDRTLEYDGDGDLKPHRMLATRVGTSLVRPTTGLPDGALYFDTTNTRLWVYVAGTTTWHYANFT